MSPFVQPEEVPDSEILAEAIATKILDEAPPQASDIGLSVGRLVQVLGWSQDRVKKALLRLEEEGRVSIYDWTAYAVGGLENQLQKELASPDNRSDGPLGRG
jgi:DNA-binding GntR family transcriptional regulator